MKKVFLIICSMALVFGFTFAAEATVINFDDITTGYYTTPVPYNYGGFTWGGFYVASDSMYTSYYGYDNDYNSPSGEYAAFNGYGAYELILSLTSGNDFDFNGAYFTGWAEHNDYRSWTATSIIVSGYNNGAFVGSASMSLASDQYTWLNAGLTGVDELRFRSSGGGDYWLMDNFTFNEGIQGDQGQGGDSPVPEPSTVVLLGAGLLGLVAMGRKKMKK